MRLGEYQELVCVKKVDFGIYLSTSSDSEERVLLPAKQIPDGVKQGDKLKVFVYKDSNDRLIATTNEPKLTLGGLSVLTVKEVTKIGAFLDWGLEKDLFLPYKEMVRKVSAGDEILVTLYIDKSQRLCATTRVFTICSAPIRHTKRMIWFQAECMILATISVHLSLWMINIQPRYRFLRMPLI